MTQASPGGEPADYLISHIRDALAHDPRTTELGVEVAVAGDRAVLGGTVASAAQRDAIGEVVGEVAPGYRVVNEVTVVAYDDAGETEDLS